MTVFYLPRQFFLFMCPIRFNWRHLSFTTYIYTDSTYGSSSYTLNLSVQKALSNNDRESKYCFSYFLFFFFCVYRYLGDKTLYFPFVLTKLVVVTPLTSVGLKSIKSVEKPENIIFIFLLNNLLFFSLNSNLL